MDSPGVIQSRTRISISDISSKSVSISSCSFTDIPRELDGESPLQLRLDDAGDSRILVDHDGKHFRMVHSPIDRFGRGADEDGCDILEARGDIATVEPYPEPTVGLGQDHGIGIPPRDDDIDPVDLGACGYAVTEDVDTERAGSHSEPLFISSSNIHKAARTLKGARQNQLNLGWPSRCLPT